MAQNPTGRLSVLISIPTAAGAGAGLRGETVHGARPIVTAGCPFRKGLSSRYRRSLFLKRRRTTAMSRCLPITGRTVHTERNYYRMSNFSGVSRAENSTAGHFSGTALYY